MGRTKRKVSQRSKNHQKGVKKARRTRVRARRGVRFGSKLRRKKKSAA